MDVEKEEEKREKKVAIAICQHCKTKCLASKLMANIKLYDVIVPFVPLLEILI